METNVNYTVVGAFVIILIACMVVGLVWLSTGFNVEEYTTYKVYMKEAVSGLGPDEPVEFNGVVVGKIADIEINKTNPQLVELLLKIKSSTPVTQGTTATLSIRGLTGVSFISLQDKGTNLAPLPIPPGERYAVIKTVPSILVQLDTIIKQLNESFNHLSESVQSLLNKENLASVKQILNSGKGTMQVIQTQTLPATNQTMMNLEDLIHNLSETAAEIRENPAALIRGTQQQEQLGPGEK